MSNNLTKIEQRLIYKLEALLIEMTPKIQNGEKYQINEKVDKILVGSLVILFNPFLQHSWYF